MSENITLLHWCAVMIVIVKIIVIRAPEGAKDKVKEDLQRDKTS